MANIMRFGSSRGSCSTGGSYGTLPPQISNFVATPGDRQVTLSWVNPSADWMGTKIIRKAGSCPQSVSDGITVYDGKGTACTDTGLNNGTTYYYRPYPYNAQMEIQTIALSASLSPTAGRLLSSLNVGDKLKFGSIFGHKIVQRVANKTDSLVTLITDGIIARYAFDAKEPSNSDNNRQNYGNNQYVFSNIHQWLNSEAGAGAWYAAQQGADQPPDSTSVVSENPYKSAAGFLNGFSAKEKNYLKTQTITVGKSSTDGGGTETLNARVWLPSETEVGLGTEFAEGSQLAAFSNDNSRIAYETADCAAHCGGTAGAAWWYWLRTRYPSDSCSARFADSGGMLRYGGAYNGNIGVRPLCNLLPDTLLSLTPDADGCYAVL